MPEAKSLLEVVAEAVCDFLGNRYRTEFDRGEPDRVVAIIRTTLAEHAGDMKTEAEFIRKIAKHAFSNCGDFAFFGRFDGERLNNIADLIQLSTPSSEVAKLQERVKELFPEQPVNPAGVKP